MVDSRIDHSVRNTDILCTIKFSARIDRRELFYMRNTYTLFLQSKLPSSCFWEKFDKHEIECDRGTYVGGILHAKEGKMCQKVKE